MCFSRWVAIRHMPPARFVFPWATKPRPQTSKWPPRRSSALWSGLPVSVHRHAVQGRMLQLDQLEFRFRLTPPASSPQPIRGCESALEEIARQLLRDLGVGFAVRVEWNSRLRSSAGHAALRERLISLNPRLQEHGFAEIERTLRHELAHLLAHHRAGRRRISPHGPEWRKACSDLGIPGEARCHTLPLASARFMPRYLYRCARCGREFPRVRPIRRAVACLDCCRRFYRGKFHSAAKLQLVRSATIA